MNADLMKIFENDGFPFDVTLKTSEKIDENFPNMPEWHKDDFSEWRRDMFPEVDVICFKYRDNSYKLSRNGGIPDCNDGSFGALYDENGKTILDIITTGDMETTLQSLKKNDVPISDELLKKLLPSLERFPLYLFSNTELEYVVFKIFVLNNFVCAQDIDDYEEEEEEEAGEEMLEPEEETEEAEEEEEKKASSE